MDAPPICETCRRPTVACVCDRITTHDTRLRVLVLQHPQERDAILGSAQILAASLPKAKIVVGLSWRNLAHALRPAKPASDPESAEPSAPETPEAALDPKRWAVLFPDRESSGGEVKTRAGEPMDPGALDGIVVLDGTWSKAKTLWWRNVWLTKLHRVTIAPKQPSIYGSLRNEPRREYVSTLESVAAALTLCGEPPEIEADLQRVFRTLVQRVRDAKIIPPAARRTRKSRAKRGARAPKGADGG